MKQQQNNIKLTSLREIGRLGVKENKFYEDRMPTLTYAEALVGNNLRNQLNVAIQKYNALLSH